MDYIIRSSNNDISQRKLEGYLKMANVINWGRQNPVQFISRFLGIDLLDYQKYMLVMSWNKPYVLWLCCRSAGKSTLTAPYIMAKSLLIPNWNAYILSNTGNQSQETFMKIEKIAKKELSSFTGLTDVFFNETVKSIANNDGFTHNPQGFKYSVYNGSMVTSLNGDPDNNRGKRSNCNVYDECGYTNEELIQNTIPFTTQNSNFRLGGDNDVSVVPKQFPNQLIFASSASGQDSKFYNLYREYSKKMFLGDKRYFVADINSDIVMKATFNGVIFPEALLSQETIDQALKDNLEKGMREYKNVFTTEGGDGQIIKRASIIRNSVVRPPVMYNEGYKIFKLAYDPARSYDNSIVTAGEFINDENVGWKLKIQNCTRLSEMNTGNSKKGLSIRTPDQVKLIQNMLVNYNGAQSADYENVELLVDQGGSNGQTIGDLFMEDWRDKKGVIHKGLLDREDDNSIVHLSKFPNSSNKIKLINPKRYKKEMFDALIEMINLDLIEFTESYDNKDELILVDNTEIVYEDENGKEQIELNRKEKRYPLTLEEKLSLKNIDLAKEELVNIYRFDGQNGNYRYDLPEDKKKKMCDDRAYTIAMLAWKLQNLRRDKILNKKKPKRSLKDAPIFATPISLD